MSFYKIVLRYDGTRFSGWQLQPGRPTIQGALEKALKEVTRRSVRVAGASRTDAGVHALAQIAVFELAEAWGPFRLRGALNALLPEEVAVTQVVRLRQRIDPTQGSSKVYHYKVWNHPVRDPLLKDRAWWVKYPLDVSKMRRALRALTGRHDFSSFAASDRTTKTSLRTIAAASIAVEGDLLTFKFRADGFLKGMVRNLVGTLVEVGRGRLAPDEMRIVLCRRDRRAAGPTAPPHGLYLVRLFR